MAPPAVGVVGASARAAVHSLARAGFAAWAVDLFGDRDLARAAPCVVCPPDDYPSALPRLAERFPPGPVLYTGGLENHPNVVAELAARRELWGNPPGVLRTIRDPFFVSRTLAPRGLNLTYPSVVPADRPPPTHYPAQRWLLKPRGGAGGRGVRFWDPGDPLPANPARWYFQEFVEGVPMSAAFVTRERTVLFGVTEQLVGTPCLHAPPFGYAGNVAPAEANPVLEYLVARSGEALAEAGGLRGVWGFDFVHGTDDATYPVEVNPRYTAGIEVLEYATGCAVFAERLAATRSGAGRVGGKAVYYAPHAFTFPDAGPWDADLAGEFDPWRLPAFADVPAAGSRFEAGQPVITLLESASSPCECRDRLQSRAAELDRLFAETSR